MGRVSKESDLKSHLVTEICSISTRPVSCTHRHGRSPFKSHLIDWYRVLGVGLWGAHDLKSFKQSCHRAFAFDLICLLMDSIGGRK